jgi:4-hydroxy-3-polyprenylbenzoate decarboxylase
LKLVPSIAELAAIPPKTVKTGVCQQVVQMGRDVDLNNLPIPRCWPSESGPTMTLGQVTTRDPETGTRDVGLYPLLVRDRDSLFVHWDRQQDGWRNFAAWQKRDQQMPVAVALGGDPILAYAAAAPLPPNTDACLFAGFLRGQNVELVQCRSVDLQVPAHAEIVIEGHIDTSAELEAAGTVASPTGFSGSDGRFPLMQVTAITHRSNPVFPALVFGKPPAEDCWFGKASERIFLPLVRLPARCETCCSSASKNSTRSRPAR